MKEFDRAASVASYRANSPYYGQLFARHGETMTLAAAELACRQHGTCIAELVRDGALMSASMVANERGYGVETLALVMALGY